MTEIKTKGQISLWVAIVGVVGSIGASTVAGIFTANVKIAVLEEREGNHYEEVQKILTRMESKMDSIIGKTVK